MAIDTVDGVAQRKIGQISSVLASDTYSKRKFCVHSRFYAITSAGHATDLTETVDECGQGVHIPKSLALIGRGDLAGPVGLGRVGRLPNYGCPHC